MSKEKSKTCRQALYFPTDILDEIQRESKRQDRSISWLIQQAWKLAAEELRRVPSTTEYITDAKPSAMHTVSNDDSPTFSLDEYLHQ